MVSSWQVYKRVNKSIAIRNFEIFQCTNLREWYVLRIIEPTLSSLEEFQKRDSIVAYILNLTVNINKHNLCTLDIISNSWEKLC